MVQRVDGVFA